MYSIDRRVVSICRQPNLGIECDLCVQVPHYHLTEATEAVKPVLGKYYREPQPSKSWFPSHLFEPLVRSFKNDHYVESTGDVVFYKTDPDFHKAKPKN